MAESKTQNQGFDFSQLVALLQLLAPILQQFLPMLVHKAPPPQAPPPDDHQNQLPDPVVVPPPPATAPVFEGLNLSVGAIYHDWFKDEIQPGVFSSDTAATLPQIAAILAGQQPLPPGAVVLFNVEPTPPGLTRDDIPLPISMVYSIKGPALNGTDTFTPVPGHVGHYAGTVANIQGQDRPGGGKFDRSDGYSGLLVTKASDQGPNEAWMTAVGGGKNSNTVHFPWVAKTSA